jgi:crotonobetainyl-CoA:carnitine CoA-transferase CaiB-like acyl-CoA transferase
MLGAEVIRIEPPGGDPARLAVGAAHAAYNRGKRVCQVDYKLPAGREAILELAASADVFLHNWRPGRAVELGLEDADVHRCNPGLVYAHAAGWGDGVPGIRKVATEFLVQAHMGYGDGLNPAGELPVPSRVTLVDVAGALVAVEGVLAALLLRERSGRGARVDTSLMSGAVALQAMVLEGVGRGDEPGRRAGRPMWGALDRPVRTAEGFLVLYVRDVSVRLRLGSACGVASLLQADAWEAAVVDQLLARSAGEWAARLSAAGVPAVVVCEDLALLPDHPGCEALLEPVADVCRVPAPPWLRTDAGRPISHLAGR